MGFFKKVTKQVKRSYKDVEHQTKRSYKDVEHQTKRSYKDTEHQVKRSAKDIDHFIEKQSNSLEKRGITIGAGYGTEGFAGEANVNLPQNDCHIQNAYVQYNDHEGTTIGANANIVGANVNVEHTQANGIGVNIEGVPIV